MIKEEIILKINNKAVYNKVSLPIMNQMCEEYWSSAKENNRQTYYTHQADGFLPEDHEELLFGLLRADIMTIMQWNKESGKYINTSILNSPLLQRFDDRSLDFHAGKVGRLILNNAKYLSEKYRDEDDLGKNYYEYFDFTHEENERFIKNIKRSLKGYVYFETPLYKTTLNDNLTIETVEPIRAYGFVALYDPYKNNVAHTAAQSKIFLADIPETKAGTKYSATKSLPNVDVIGFGNIYDPDNEIDPYEDISNFKSGFLETNYNHNTGKYEAGTRQIIARLLVDLPACNMPEIDLENISHDSKVFYDKDFESNQVGDFDLEIHAGHAISLNVQKGNPYLFGPNFHRTTEYGETLSIDKTELEKILVINRTPIAFSANEYIMCSKIDGEWIPQKFVGGESSKVKFGIRNWSFQKMIANSDSYFRDDRYYSNLDGTIDEESYENQVITHASYQQKMRNKFYIDLYETDESTAEINFNPLSDSLAGVPAFLGDKKNYDIIPSTRYWQITAFDQMGDFAGGKNEKNIIARTNIIKSPDGLPDEDGISPRHWIEWWGPSFVDGYKTTQVQNLLNEKNNLHIRAQGKNSSQYFFYGESDSFVANEYDVAIVDTLPGVDLDRNLSLEYSNTGMFGNDNDFSALNLPAEVATNAFPKAGSICSPLEDSKVLIENYGCLLREGNMIEATNNIMALAPNGIQERFNWLYKYNNELSNSGIDNSVYGLEPNSPNKIDFFSLPAEAISSADYNRDTYGEGVTRDYGNEILMNENLASPKYPDHILGSDFIFTRNSHCGTDFDEPLIRHTGGDEKDPDYSVVNRTMPYDAYVKERSKSSVGNVSTPFIWTEDTADCVGIIASKCTITFKGQELKFIVNQQFGLRANRTITVGQGATFSVLPIGGFGSVLSAAGTSGLDFTTPRWGGPSDNPESFHTTALHARIYDSWPAEQTIYDARYFAVFHYNPGTCLSSPRTIDTEITKKDNTKVTLPIDQIDTLVDFRVPTDINNNIISFNEPFDSDLEMMPVENWRVNTVRRGMMLSNGGFKYHASLVGLSEDYHIIDGGSEYEVGDILTAQGGSGSGASYRVTGAESGTITALIILNPGAGYLSSDFGVASEPQLSKVNLVGTKGDLNIKINKGVVYKKVEHDKGPVERSGSLRLTQGNNRGLGNNGQGEVAGFYETSFVFDETNQTGEYDIFLYYHNDITHTVYSTEDYFYSPVQHVLLEINAI